MNFQLPLLFESFPPILSLPTTEFMLMAHLNFRADVVKQGMHFAEFYKVTDELNFMTNRIGVQEVEPVAGSEASNSTPLLRLRASRKFPFFHF